MTEALRRAGIVVCLALFVGGAPALAQVSTGEIFGKAADGTGAVLPGVAVTLSGPALIQPLVAVTAESGAYRFPRIPIGSYTLAFDLTGFKKFVKTGVKLDAAEKSFRESLSRVRNNGWALAGLAETYRRKGDAASEHTARRAFAKAWLGSPPGPALERL